MQNTIAIIAVNSYVIKKSGGNDERTVFIQNRNQTQNFYRDC